MTVRSEERGFTLMELLVVIGVVGIAASLLLSALASALESARSARCAGHLRQLGTASFLYAGDHGGSVPSFSRWLYAKGKRGQLETGQIFPYLGSDEIYMCPTDRRQLARERPRGTASPPARPAGPPRPRDFGEPLSLRRYSYGMNCGVCHATKYSAFLTPSETMLYMEADFYAFDQTGQVGPSRSGLSDALAQRHHRRGRLLMADAHVETMNEAAFEDAARKKRFWLPDGEVPEDFPAQIFFEGLE